MEVVRVAKRLILALVQGAGAFCFCFACGEARPAPEPAASATKEPLAASVPGRTLEAQSNQAATTPAATTAKPPTVFRDTRLPREAWFSALAANAMPSKTAWRNEALAIEVEGLWRAWSQGKGDRLPGAVQEGLSVQVSLAFDPKVGKTLANHSGILAREWLPEGASAPADPMVAGERLRACLGEDPATEWHVLAVQETAPSEVTLRVWARAHLGSESREFDSEQVWTHGNPPRLMALRLVRLRALELVASEGKRTLFMDRTRGLIAPEAWERSQLGAGGTELVGRHDRLYAPSTMYLGMHGLAVGDVTGDGLEDLYMARGAGFPNQLWVRQADGSVVDRALAAGVADLDDSAGVLVCDLDGDGARDLVCAMDSLVVISWNDGKGTFPERTVLNQGQGAAAVYSLSAADADGDGDLDLYDTRYFASGRMGSAPTPYYDANNGAPNSFWRNLGERRWVDATVETGLAQNNHRFSLAALWEDLDGDGDLDLYVTNDFGRNNLYNNEGGHFTDIAEESGAVDMAASMGIAAHDVDGDGKLDLYVSNMHTPAGKRVVSDPRFQKDASPAVRAAYLHHTSGNSLLMGAGNGKFLRSEHSMEVGPGGWAWGAVFLDFDGDGLQDLFVPNGFATGKRVEDLDSFFWREVVARSPLDGRGTAEYLRAWQCITTLALEDGYSWNGHERDFAYWNLGGGRFADASAITGLDWPEDGRCASVVDWDLDGRPDLWLSKRSAPIVRFLHNEHRSPHHFVGVELKDRAPNTEAVGAQLALRVGDAQYVARIHAGDSYLGHGSKRRLFSWSAESAGNVELEIRWPDGEPQRVRLPQTNAYFRIERGAEPVRFEGVEVPLEGVSSLVPASGDGTPLVRVLPADRLALGALDLPSFERTRIEVGDLGPAPVLLVFYASWSGGGAELLADLAERVGKAAWQPWLVNLDPPKEEGSVVVSLRTLGLWERSGRGGRRMRNLVDTILGEIVGAASDRPLPLALLLDKQSRLAALYLGELPWETIATDAELLAREGAKVDPNFDLLAQGSWFGPRPKRGLEGLAAFLERAGEAALARGILVGAEPR